MGQAAGPPEWAGMNENAIRRSYMLVASLLALLLGLLDNGQPRFSVPDPSWLGWGTWLVIGLFKSLPVVAGVLAISATLFRRSGRLDKTRRLDSHWRKLGRAAIYAWAGLGTLLAVQLLAGWDPSVTLLPEFFSSTFAPLVMLTAACMEPRSLYWLPAAAPIILVATYARQDAYGLQPWQSTLMMILFGLLTSYLLAWVVYRARRLDAAAAALSRTTRKLAAAQAETVAKRKGEDFVHDEILSVLSLVGKGQLGANEAAPLATRARSQLERSEQRHSIYTVSQVLAALQAEIGQHDVPINLTSSVRTQQELTFGVAQAFIAAAQQAIRNSVEHAGTPGRPVRRHVSLEADSKGMRVVVWDDGIGFDPAQASHRHGLNNSILRRARDVAIEVKLTAAPGRGTRVSLEVPAPIGKVDMPLWGALGRRELLIGGLVVLAHSAFCLFIYWDGFSVPAISHLCLTLLAGAVAVAARRREGPMGRQEARYFAALLVATDVLQSLTMVALPNSPDWDHWASNAVTLMLCLLVLWGHRRVAWTAMAINSLALAWGTHTSGASWARYANFEVGHISQLAIWTLLAAVTEHTAHQIDARIRQHNELEMWLEIERRSQEKLQKTREAISRRISPLLTRIEAGQGELPDVRMEAALLEAELRDELRGACFKGSRVPGAARRLRAAGAEVVLLDDSAGKLSGAECDRIEEVVVPALQELAAQIEAERAGQAQAAQWGPTGAAASAMTVTPQGARKTVVVRVPPVSRNQLVVVTSDGQGVLTLER